MGNNAASNDVLVDLDTEMRTFDDLPARLRAALNYAVGCFSAYEIVDLLRDGFSEDEIAAALAAKKRTS